MEAGEAHAVQAKVTLHVDKNNISFLNWKLWRFEVKNFDIRINDLYFKLRFIYNYYSVM